MSSPYCKTLLLCDTVVCDVFTDRWSLVGVTSRKYTSNFPALLPRLSAYAVVYDCGGDVSAKFLLRDPEQAVVQELDFPQLRTARQEENEFGAVFVEVPIPKPGRYSVEFILDGNLLASSRLDVQLPLVQ